MFLSLIHDGTTGPLPVGGSVQLSLGAARWDLGLAQLVAQVATTPRHGAKPQRLRRGDPKAAYGCNFVLSCICHTIICICHIINHSMSFTRSSSRVAAAMLYQCSAAIPRTSATDASAWWLALHFVSGNGGDNELCSAIMEAHKTWYTSVQLKSS